MSLVCAPLPKWLLHRAFGKTESLDGATFRSCGFHESILGWCGRFERMKKTGRDARYLVYCGTERVLVCLGWLGETADLSHELKRR